MCIHSPPRAAGGQSSADMYDPDTYYRKFEVYGEIVFITICLKNGNLMKVCGEGCNTKSSGGKERSEVLGVKSLNCVFSAALHETQRHRK